MLFVMTSGDLKKRARSPSDSAADGQPNKRKGAAGMPKYDPDDDMSDVQLMIKINELKTASADEKERLMSETFGGHRRMILRGATAQQPLQDYPELFAPEGFRKEVHLLTGKPSYLTTAGEKLDLEMEKTAAMLKSPEEQVRYLWTSAK